MDLLTSLAATESLADLPAVVAALGHEPLWEEIPVAGWLATARWHDDVRRAALVGRTGRWPWYGVEADDPAAIARRVSAHRYRAGTACGILALDASRRRLAVAVAADTAPVLELPLDAPDRLALATLRRAAADPRPGPMEQSLHVADALAHRGVDAAFFSAFRDSRDQLAASLRGPDAEGRDAVALLQLTRILFLYFIQAKGWLNGEENFLSSRIEATLRRGRHPARDLLRPLFFGTLNRPLHDRTAVARRFGSVPFLNGGLFEPHPLERACTADAPAPLWRDIFDRLFERFHFTVAEGTASDIAPEMLGRVFEGLMTPAARKLSGTFYTPPAIVARVVRAGLVALIESRLGLPTPQAELELTDVSPAVAKLAAGISILDPAAGSGAFLLGALDAVTRLRNAHRSADCRLLTSTRRAVLRQNLFGVDLSPVAVRLAELRLWLAVVRDDPAGPGDNVEPLPNLDCVVRQGDSLRDPLPPLGIPLADTAPLAAARAAAFSATGPAKRAALHDLRRAERRAGLAFFAAAERRAEQVIAECLADARSATLFGERRGADPATRDRLRAARLGRGVAREGARKLRREGELPWFHYPSHFAEVFARGGFDLIVGNPPWVRAEALAPPLRRELAERYRWWRGGGRSGFRHLPDLSVAFTERALELAAPGGVVAFLLPAKLASSGYGGAARLALGRDHRVNIVADLSRDPEARFSATTYPMALVVTRRRPTPEELTAITLAPAGPTMPQGSLAVGGPWVLRGPKVGQIALRLAARFPTLADHAPIHLGVKTGNNRAYFDPPESVEDSVVRWALRGREIRPFDCVPLHRMLWPCDDDGHPLAQLPPGALTHLRQWRRELEGRADRQGMVWWTVFRTAGMRPRHRVVWPDLARHLTAVALSDRPDIVPVNTCYVAAAASARGALVLAAWLNSTPIRILARLGADPAMGGFARFNARTVGAIPFPVAAPAHPTLSTLATRANADPDFQVELDACVADLLGLDAADRAALLADDRR